MNQDAPDIVYAIDADDDLVELSRSWQLFAEQNEGGIGLLPRSVLGQSLWSYVRGESLQSLYREVIDAVRRSGRQFRFRFRCDSPALRRHMHMCVQPLPDRVVRFYSRTLSVEHRDLSLHVVEVSAGDHHLLRCSICNRFELPDGAWSDALDAVAQGEAMNQDRPVQVIWSVCPDCRANLQSQIHHVRNATK